MTYDKVKTDFIPLGIRFGATKRLNGTTLNHPKLMFVPKYVDQINEHRVVRPITGIQIG